MTDTPPKPKRSRWRSLVMGFTVVAGLVLIWLWRADVLFQQRVEQIQVGQSKADVRLLLGDPDVTSFRGAAGSYHYGPGRARIWAVRTLAFKHLKIGSPPKPERFSCEVTFDDDGLVTSVHRLE